MYAVGGTASSYAIRSKAAVVLALVTKRQGGQLLQALLPELLRLASGGATQAETVSCPAPCVAAHLMSTALADLGHTFLSNHFMQTHGMLQNTLLLLSCTTFSITAGGPCPQELSTPTVASGFVSLSVQVCIVLRMMAEEVTQYRDDLEADNKRQLLSALTACVPQVLPFLEQSMEGHFGQAVTAAQQGQHQTSQLHAAVVTAALGKLACQKGG